MIPGTPLRRLTLALVAVLMLAAPTAPLWAAPGVDIVADPNSTLYRYLDLWERGGLVGSLPAMRPYPVSVVKAALETVDHTGRPQDRAVAERYLGDIAGAVNVHPEALLEVNAKSPNELPSATSSGASADSSKIASSGSPGASVPVRVGANVTGQGELLPWLTYSADFTVALQDAAPFSAIPAGSYPVYDYLEDWADIPAFGRLFQVRQALVSELTIGTPDVYFQSGMMRSDFGPFFRNGAVFGGQARETPRFLLHWQSGLVAIDWMYLELAATDSTGATKTFPGKHLNFQDIGIDATPWLHVSAFDTVVWGGRFDLSYFVPLTYLYFNQGITGFPDNALIGLSYRIRLPQHISTSGLVYIDDINFDQVVRFNFNTKWKLSFQVAANWTPLAGMFESLSLDYLAIMPYMYTHRSTSATDPNYDNYTTMGENLGPALPPNTDRLELTGTFAPAPKLLVDVTARLIRHGNASDGITSGSGSLFDDGYNGSTPTFQNETRFLTQSVIERTYQAGVHAQATVPLGNAGSMELSAGYLAQYITDYRLNAAATSFDNFLSFGARYRY